MLEQLGFKATVEKEIAIFTASRKINIELLLGLKNMGPGSIIIVTSYTVLFTNCLVILSNIPELKMF